MTKRFSKFLWVIPLFFAGLLVVLSFSITGVSAQPLMQKSADASPTKTPTPTFTATLPQPATKTTQPPEVLATPSPVILGTNNPFPTQEMVLGTVTPLPNVATYTDKASFTFKDLAVPEIVLHYPDVDEFYMNLPDRWLISPSASYFDIHYSLYEEWGSKLRTKSIYRYTYGVDRPQVEVYVGEYLAGIFFPEVGTNLVARIKMPFGMVASRAWNTDNAYTVRFRYVYSAGGSGWDMFCDYNGILTIHDISSLSLTFKNSPPSLTLSEFPRVLIQNSFIPETMLIVIPDDYTEQDLSIAAQISAAIGKGSADGNVSIMIEKASQVSPQGVPHSGMVIIGEPKRNAYLRNLYANNVFVTQLNSGGQIGGVGSDEGLLQVITSNLNRNVGILSVTGNNATGVSHAANALLYPPVGLAGPFFIARESYSSQVEATPVPDVYQFSDFGYVERVFYTGTFNRSFSFYVPRNWALQEGAKLAISYAHSANISYGNSGITVYLNNSPIGSLPLLPQDTSEVQRILPLPKDGIVAGGLNTIRFEVTVRRDLDDCSIFEPNVSWINIRATSLIHLPYQIITDPKNFSILHDPIFYLFHDPKMVIVLPEKPLGEELNSMVNVARIVGTLTRAYHLDIAVSTNPNLDTNALKDYNFVSIGRPSRSSIIQLVNDDLPQPFVPGDDALTMQQKIGEYRIDQSISTGLVEALASPWNPQQAITIITGTTDEALKWASDKLTSTDTVYDFLGELSFVSPETIESFQSKVPLHLSLAKVISDITGQKASLEPVLQPTSQAAAGGTPSSVVADRYVQTQAQTTLSYGTYAIIALVVVAIIIAAISITRTIRGGRRL